jgi:succinate dehydrogenase / fumarate reductase flavoprotein subunit
MTEEATLDGRRHRAADEEGPADERIETPVLIVGAGAAGARTAIGLAEQGVESLVVSKRDHGDAHTKWAAGGINAALGSLDPEDSPAIHAADTLKEGHFLNDPVAVETVTESMPERIRELDEWGCPFARTDDGRIAQRFFGAQSYRRTCFVGDRTGEAMLETLIDRARELEVPYRDNVLITRIVRDGAGVRGAVGVDQGTGDVLFFRTDHVVVAAGGFSALYDRHSSRDDENTGDGPALAYEAGARLMDAEFVQFHPTGMVGERYGDDWDGRLVTEAVRGEGGRLFNGEGERFMERYSPDQMELDARDVVARAIAREIAEGRGTGGAPRASNGTPEQPTGGVYLDISHRSREFLQDRLPRMYERFQSLGVDMAEEPVEVAPTAHYTMGGVEVDFRTAETRVPGLYAVGETTAGVHGANRLGGNSLAETVALGARLGDHLADRGPAAPTTTTGATERAVEDAVASVRSLADADGEEDPEAVLDDLRGVLADHAGILREATSLEEGIEELDRVRDRAEDLRVEGGPTGIDFEYAVDLGFALTCAEALLRGALVREESRGAHHRTDAPETSDDWRKNVVYERGPDGEMHLGTRPVGEPSAAVKEALAEGHELQYTHLE